ncbi:MAG: cobalamin-binding protein [Conexibacter sp.]|nr:cobalamin-binding protein [Conexibacter sp.]
MVAEHDDETRAAQLALAEQFQRAYADALLAGAPRAAEGVIREAIESGLAEALIDDRVIRPALQLVGDLWADGRMTIAEEHLATAISMRVLTLQREAFRVARQRASQRVLLAGAQGEQHVVGLEMAGSLILHAGYDVRLFGADLPVGQITAAVQAHRPAVVGLTTATSLSAAHLPAALSAMRCTSPHVGIVVGGRAVNDAWATTYDVVVCHHVSDAVDHVDALVQRAGHN